MEEQKDMFALLDMMVQPVFCVKDHTILYANPPASQLFLRPGESILPFLGNHTGEYSDFSGGCLYLPLSFAGQTTAAFIRRLEDMDVFELDYGSDSNALRAMALAAASLRRPLSGALTGTAALLESQKDPDTMRQLSQLNRNLYQLLRLLGNMSDAESLSSRIRMETVDCSAFFRELFGKARDLVSQAGVTLTYGDLKESVFSLVNRTQLERAVWNMLSNAMKFSPQGGHITASLVRRGNTLRLTVQDSGCGISREVLGSLFQRYLRQPGIEDGRYGLGLGLRLVHSAALCHGGTLLLTQNEQGGTRAVLTLAIRQKEPGSLCSPIFEIDYAGGFDHSLVELSESLPAELYDGTH